MKISKRLKRNYLEKHKKYPKINGSQICVRRLDMRFIRLKLQSNDSEVKKTLKEMNCCWELLNDRIIIKKIDGKICTVPRYYDSFVSPSYVVILMKLFGGPTFRDIYKKYQNNRYEKLDDKSIVNYVTQIVGYFIAFSESLF